MLLLAVTLLILVVIVGLLIYARWHYGELEKMGLPVVKHHPLLGSTRELYENPGGANDINWMKKYGKIFGVYEGRQPQIHVCEPELVRLICVKDAAYFDSKRMLDFQDPVLNEMPDFQPLEKWRLLRSMATPAFTSAKIKMMNLPMKEAAIDFVTGIKKKIRASGNGVYEKLAVDGAVHTMLTDLISRCVFSVRISGNEGDDSEFGKLVQMLVSPPQQNQSKELTIWSHTFPFLRRFMTSTIFGTEPIARFVAIFKQMMDERRKSGKMCNDVVDMCLEWYDKLDTPEYKNAKINELSIFCQALVFYFASQDQISTMTAMVIYHMTQDPEIEKKVYEEVDSVFAKHNGKIEHEHLPEFVYLTSCLNEALRLYPFFHRTERVCTKDWDNEEYNLHIKKGMTIILPIWATNRCSDHNPDGDKFIPERFMPENKDRLNPFSSTSFGHGPRNCTGVMFAREAMPMVAAYMLKDLKFRARKDTKIKFISGGPIFAPHEPIVLDVMERKK